MKTTSTIREAFDPESNFDVYCWLKATLPSEYYIQSEPQAGYYSEWFYDYQVYKGNILVKRFMGNFNDLSLSQLVEEAKTFLQEIGA